MTEHNRDQLDASYCREIRRADLADMSRRRPYDTIYQAWQPPIHAETMADLAEAIAAVKGRGPSDVTR